MTTGRINQVSDDSRRSAHLADPEGPRRRLVLHSHSSLEPDLSRRDSCAFRRTASHDLDSFASDLLADRPRSRAFALAPNTPRLSQRRPLPLRGSTVAASSFPLEPFRNEAVDDDSHSQQEGMLAPPPPHTVQGRTGRGARPLEPTAAPGSSLVSEHNCSRALTVSQAPSWDRARERPASTGQDRARRGPPYI